MSQQQDGPSSKGQSNVRVIPIHVEGRDEPVINRDFTDGVPPQMHSQAPPPASHHQYEAPPPRMPDLDADLGFGREIPSFGSIFDRTKDFPVRNLRDEFFRDRMSPSRADSPLRSHMFTEPQVHRFGRGPSPQPQERPRTNSGSYEQQYQHPQQQQQTAPQQKKRTSSRNDDQQQYHHQPSPQPQPAPSTSPKQPNQPQATTQQPQPQPEAAVPPQKEATPPPPPKPKLGPIEKIQQIQRDVLDLMTKVEHFEGKGKRDKEYLWLDEMLTQNLLKLDTVNTDGQENVKLARKEAVKCINRCLSVLEAKAEASEDVNKASLQSVDEQQSAGIEPSSSSVSVEFTHQPSNVSDQSNTAAGSVQETEVTKQSSRGSIYDNHDPSAETDVSAPIPVTKEPTPQPKSKESTPAPAELPSVAAAAQ